MVLQHALHGMLDDALGMLCQCLFESLGLQSTGIAAVTEVLLLELLATRDADLLGVDDNDEVAGVNMGRVLGLVLPAKDGGALRGKAAQDDVFCVDQVPLALDFAGLCAVRFHNQFLLFSECRVCGIRCWFSKVQSCAGWFPTPAARWPGLDSLERAALSLRYGAFESNR